ncbi:hypothetical protein BDC45DRAFT_529153, partial [Circinella umbellata]
MPTIDCIMKNVFAKSQVDNFPKLEYLAVAVSIETCYLSLSQNYFVSILYI